MIYGNAGTIHGTQHLDVEVDGAGKVVAVWFRCCALPFEQTDVHTDRAVEMEQMYKHSMDKVYLNAVDIEREPRSSN